MTNYKFMTIFYGLLMAFLLPASTVNAQSAPSSLSETYQNWTVRCVTVNVANKPGQICEMNQVLRQREGGKTLLTASLRVKDAGATLTLIAPFGLLLSEGIGINVADKQILKMGFRTCLPAGCIALSDIPLDTINKLAAAKDATIVMVGSANRQKVEITVSLAGFTAAWNRLGKVKQ